MEQQKQKNEELQKKLQETAALEDVLHYVLFCRTTMYCYKVVPQLVCLVCLQPG